jgi:hypothetical protein
VSVDFERRTQSGIALRLHGGATPDWTAQPEVEMFHSYLYFKFTSGFLLVTPGFVIQINKSGCFTKIYNKYLGMKHSHLELKFTSGFLLTTTFFWKKT